MLSSKCRRIYYTLLLAEFQLSNSRIALEILSTELPGFPCRLPEHH
jgi:hypothetical protein